MLPSGRSPLLFLLEPVVARLAKALQVVLIPEQVLFALMADLVVSDQLRGVGLDPSASHHLAGEEITLQHLHAQLLPTSRLVPLPPTNVTIALCQASRLAFRPSDARAQRCQPWLECRESAHNP